MSGKDGHTGDPGVNRMLESFPAPCEASPWFGEDEKLERQQAPLQKKRQERGCC